ncbi:MAG TPA: lamin tail domain-containing protein, partial [Verrucomicrobiae bacterium]|nr:lamin tail domain-containing protein [Verrucomicrobiae bacterium]
TPYNGALYNGPGTIFLGAVASAASGSITQVNFYAGADLVASATNAPYFATWENVPVGDYALSAASFADTGRAITSAVVNVSVIVAEPPVIVSVDPPPGEIANFSSLRVTFSRGVYPIAPTDLLVNGLPASKSFTYDLTNWFFSFPAPSGSTVTISWDPNAAIFDIASPPLPFDTMSANATWTYTILDLTAPLVIAQSPPAGASLSELTNVTVTFSEPVSGVDATDLLVNGGPATSVAGSDATYTFGFPQPAVGIASFTWASGHNIRDVAPAMNPFDSTSPGATWNYVVTLPQAQLVSTNATWRFLRGTNEASVPADAWRQPIFSEESSWTALPAVFYYGENWPTGFLIPDMLNSYSCIFLRHAFVVTNAALLTDLRLRAQCDDGYIAWLNGLEIFRYNMPPGEMPFNAFAVSAVTEQGVPSVPFLVNSLPGLETLLMTGTNVLAVQVFNATLNSSDLVFDCELLAGVTDLSAVAPRLLAINPPPGNATSLTNITVTFSEPVTGVDVSDLIVAGVPATEVSGSNDVYSFQFPQPAFGSVPVTWDPQHGIQDQDNPPKPFNGAAAGFSYLLINASAPVLALRSPTAGATVSNLAQITLVWNEPVTGVDASDLLVNGAPASGISGEGTTMTFTFPQPPFGSVSVAFAPNSGITDLDQPPNAFDATAPGTSWQYTLRDFVPPVIVSQIPPAGASVSNLTEITVVFSKPVTNVNASDLLINGVASTNAGGGGTTYTFRFPQPNSKTVLVTWAGNHGITDRATIPNAFNAAAPAASWQYNLIDRVAPTLASISPAPGGVVKSLTQVTVAFSEDVGGVDAPDLRINGAAATSVSGSLRGPYAFNFPQPASSNVTVSWIATHGIHDFASPSNFFVTNIWTYQVVTNLNPPAVVLNEIMYHAPGANTNDEWIELLNTGASPLNLTGWRFTDGVEFTFPDVTLGAGAYLIVAANPARFASTHPAVTNVFGPWSGFLNNSGERIELRDDSGTLVDSVRYSDEGEWGVRQRGPNDRNAFGWEWFAEHDGLGKSLERANPALPGESGQNWKASLTANGTPGGANSVFTTNLPPLILDAHHSPAVPRSTDNVTITARLPDEQTNGLAATLFYRNHSSIPPPTFSSTNLFDDGLHGDGGAHDGLFGVVLPAQANRTVIEFYVRAVDSSSHTNFWPAPAGQTNLTTSQTGQIFAQTANALYQVDDTVYTGAQPIHRLILTESERAELQAINRQSDAEMNCTLIISDGVNTDVRYLCGMRIRGAGSRGAAVPNYRVNLPHDTPWNGATALNHNAQYGFSQVLGAALVQKSGLVAAKARTIQVRVNGQNLAGGGLPQYGNYALLEVFNGDWAETHLPADSKGNVYRASSGNHTASLADRGVNPVNYIADGFSKVSNTSENDWSDLVLLCQTLNNTPDATYAPSVRAVVNVEQWMRYFAFFSLTVSRETSLGNGIGDDYGLYRGVNDTRFLLLVHDLDTILGQGDTASVTNTPLFRMIVQAPGHIPPNVPQLVRFMRHPDFVPIYFRELKRLAETVFSPAEFNPLIDQTLGAAVPTLTLNTMKTYARDRASWVLSQIPLRLVINGTPGPNGFLTSSNGVISLSGTANVIDTRSVLVNGETAAWSAADTNWSFANLPLAPGINRVLVQALDASGAEIDRATVDVLYDDNSVEVLAGTLGTNTILSAGGGPYLAANALVVPAGSTLTIQPGTTLYFAPGAALTVQGRLLAEGNDTQRIRFAAQPGTAGGWGGVTISGGAGSPETRIAFAHFEGNNATAIHSAGGTVFLDHLTFSSTGQQYVSLDASSFVVQDCVFPATTASFEPTHGTGGIKAGGRGIFRRNFLGKVIGYNDAFDFTGGNRPGPILQVINNVFMGSDDDLLDLDSTDAWIEGNIFLHCHRNGSPDSASAISGGADNADTSEITAVGNLFFDVDQAANAKQGNFYTLVNNTIVHQSKIGSQDTNTAVVILADDGTVQGAGMYLEGNIILDAENLTRNVTTALVTFTNNIIYHLAGAPWTGPGGDNVSLDPLLKQVPPFSVTSNFTSWAQAQVMWDYFSLRTGSPAVGTGPNGRDKGGVIPLGASISGEPEAVTLRTTATLTVGTARSGNGIPAAGFPDGSGYTHYRWRLDGGAWSAETPVATPISLSALPNGPHSVDVTGRRDSGLYQDDAVLGADALVTTSRRWRVDTTAQPLRLNEVLARNVSAVNHNGTFPDLVELYNAGASGINLNGVRLTDDPAAPNKFVFPNVTIAAGQHLVLYADSAQNPGIHLGFNLDADGDQLLLFDRASRGGALLDAVSWGPQLADLSIGRVPSGGWSLTQPTFGTANLAARTGDPSSLRINEWLASPRPPFVADFVELFNSAPLPVPMGGLFLSDEPSGLPGMHAIAPLSFVAAGGFAVFTADGEPGLGALHLNFQLASEQGAIALSDPQLNLIDCVIYGPQTIGVSQGRVPSGSASLGYFSTPNPGSANPQPTGTNLNVVLNEILANNVSFKEPDGSTPDWAELYNPSTNAVDLGDMSLTDDTFNARRYVFPAGTMIPALGYRTIRLDGDIPAGTNNTGFGLKATGSGLHLYDKPANGGAQLSSIEFGVQAPDFSIGHVPDAAGPWALNLPTLAGANIAATLGNPASLKVNEWLANPDGGDDWFEIYNPEPQPVALGGLHLTDHLDNRMKHPIAALSFIATGLRGFQRFVADEHTAAGADHVNFRLDGTLGEALGIADAAGGRIDDVTFGPQLEAVSEGRLPDGAPLIVSFPSTSTPGDANFLPLTNVVINEVLTHTDEPFEDAIELRNLTGADLDLSGWFLSDTENNLKKLRIPDGTMLPASEFLVLYENQFNPVPGDPLSFSLNSARGDEVWLSAADTNGALTGLRATVKFGAAEDRVSFGRYETSVGVDFVAMNQRTFGADEPANILEFRTGMGAANSGPRVGPIIISEIHYHPPDVGGQDNSADEFIELQNITAVPVALFHPLFPSNTWRLRDAADFDFPPGVTLPGNGLLLVLNFDPGANAARTASFQARFGVPAGVPLFGPFRGKLANDSDNVELYKPDAPQLPPDPDAGLVPYVLVERVRYSDAPPWPTNADGGGTSLQRVQATAYGNDPVNWVAAQPSAGLPTQDNDGDGIPNSWELAYGLNPADASDATLDSDGDGQSNLQEFLSGTDPTSAQSLLRIRSIELLRGANPAVSLQFAAVSNHGYTVFFSDDLKSGVWTKLADVLAPHSVLEVELIDPLPTGGAQRSYRIVTPALTAGSTYVQAPSGAGFAVESVNLVPQNQFVLGWTLEATVGTVLESSPSIVGGSWTDVRPVPARSQARRVFVVERIAPGESQSFYRFRQSGP